MNRCKHHQQLSLKKQNMHAIEESKDSELEKVYQTLEKTIEPPQEKATICGKKPEGDGE